MKRRSRVAFRPSQREGLAANEIESVTGILDGTCNYILADGRDFADVLKDAQAAMRKPIRELRVCCRRRASLQFCRAFAFGREVDFGSVNIEGIEKITAADIKFAKEFATRSN